jgi:hypothetical protein
MTDSEQEYHRQVQAVSIRTDCQTPVISRIPAHAAVSETPSATVKRFSGAVASRQCSPPANLRNDQTYRRPEEDEKHEEVTGIIQVHR